MNEKRKFHTDLRSLKRETRVYLSCGRGPGGQRRNKKETCVRLRHIPSGVTVTATEHRYQARNKELAFERLQKRLTKLNKRKKPRIPTKISRARKEKILERKKRRAKKKKLRRKVEITLE
ncbi:peptide chain release factor-like protein [bacterium]|nr:peptide chain release factor-like protein [bacterium]MBU4560680.1 peptide chain release factor-like protein [bacterium]MCG2678257.1 peptide chain release factor-like protein [bacterium]